MSDADAGDVAEAVSLRARGDRLKQRVVRADDGGIHFLGEAVRPEIVLELTSDRKLSANDVKTRVVGD